MKLKNLFAAVASIGACANPSQSWGSPATEAAPDPSPSDYAAAAKLLTPYLQGLVPNDSVQPHWIGDSGGFWYKRDGEGGQEFVVVTADGVKTAAFDHEAVAQAMYTAMGEQRSGKGLPVSLTDVRLSDDLANLSGRLGERAIDCDLKAPNCRISDAPPATPELLPSPDGRQALLTRDNNLFVRNLRTGEERALTSDGAPAYSWALEPFFTAMKVWPELQPGVKWPPFHAYWSPDGRYVIAPRVDERGVGLWPYVEWVPTDGSKRPIVHNVRLPLPGDRETVKLEYFLFDLESGQRTAIQLPQGYPELSWPARWAPVLGWSQSRGQAFIMARTVGWKSAAVFRVDLATGDVTKVIEESAATRFEVSTFWSPSNVRLVGDGAEIVWYSERTGWAHLYLYDAQSGRLKNAITGGDWAVQDLQAIDEGRREIYFTAAGREPGQDLYYRQLYRARLDGGPDIARLSEADADHQFEVGSFLDLHYREPKPSALLRPSAGVFIDTWSTVDRPPVSELRSTRDGRLIAQLERADASRLLAAGWVAPVRERVKAADGTTDLYATYFAPQGRTAGSKYPVIDSAYNGASSLRTPRNFTQAYALGRQSVSALTRLGFAVVVVDGRGTAGRSKAFRDAGYPEFTQVGIDDHVAAIRQLAERHPEMDTERVGVYGVSWGGTFAAQAILSRPEFYKVAVSIAGAYDYAALETGYEAYIGLPIYADGTSYRGHPSEVPANWEKVQIINMADRLQGHLLITYGDMDEQARPSQAQLLIAALARANKPYDLIYVPNGDHCHFNTSYVMKRTWDYFIEHLRGAKPVWDFNIGLPQWHSCAHPLPR
jgi:dipeptidyl aminopeptidase/acylaminoacyl peptidase